MEASEVFLDSDVDVNSAITELFAGFGNRRNTYITRSSINNFSFNLGDDAVTLPFDTLETFGPSWAGITLDSGVISKDDTNPPVIMPVIFTLYGSQNFAGIITLQYSEKGADSWQNFASRAFYALHTGTSAYSSSHVAIFDLSGFFDYRLQFSSTQFSTQTGSINVNNVRAFPIVIPGERTY